MKTENRKTQEIGGKEYSFVGNIVDGLVAAQQVPEDPKKTDGKWGFLNEEFEIAIPFDYEWTGEFLDGIAPVKKDGKYGWINTAGELVTGLVYNDACNVLGVHRITGGELIFDEKTQKWVAVKY